MDFSLSDLKAALGDNNGTFGGGGLLFVVILFLFFVMFGGGWGNNQRGDLDRYATAASQQEILFGLPSGPSIVDRGNNLGIGRTGLYRVTVQAILAVTTAGTVYLQAYYDGVPITAARKSRPAVVGSTEITLDNLVYMVVPDSCGCNDVTLQVDVYAWTDDSAAATVSSLTVNLLKEA